MSEFIYYEDSWNEENWRREVLDGGTISTSTPKDDTEGPRGSKQVQSKTKT